MTVLKKLRQGRLPVVDQENVAAQPIVPRIQIPRDELTSVGRTALHRAILELERRFCGNKTEKITGADVTLSKDELVATLLDPRTVSCHHLSAENRKRAMSLFVDVYVKFAVTAVNGKYIRNPFLTSPQKSSSALPKKRSSIVSGISFESGG